MTNNEAIGILAIVVETAKGRCFVTDEAISDAYDMAVNALKAQIPKKPYTNVIHYPYTSDLTTVQCPNCKRRLRTRRTQTKGDRFCPDCGQAIDWEG